MMMRLRTPPRPLREHTPPRAGTSSSIVMATTSSVLLALLVSIAFLETPVLDAAGSDYPSSDMASSTLWSVRIYSAGGYPSCYGAIQGQYKSDSFGECVAPPAPGWPALKMTECSGLTKPMGAGYMRGTFYSDNGCKQPLNVSFQSPHDRRTYNWIIPQHYFHVASDSIGAVQWLFKNPNISGGFDYRGCEHDDVGCADDPYCRGTTKYKPDPARYGCVPLAPLQLELPASKLIFPDGTGNHAPGVNSSARGVEYLAECYASTTVSQPPTKGTLPVYQPPAAHGPDTFVPLPHESCIANSSRLDPSECIAWQKVYDGLGGKDWRLCSDSRNNPCGCNAQNHTLDTAIAVTCSVVPQSGDNQTLHVVGISFTDNYKDNSHNFRVDDCFLQLNRSACLAFRPPQGLDHPKPRCFWNPYRLMCSACSIQNQVEELPPALGEFPWLGGLRISNTHGAAGRLPSEQLGKLKHVTGIDTDSSGIFGPAPAFNYSQINACEMLLGECPLPSGVEHCCGGGIMGVGAGCGCHSCPIGGTQCLINNTNGRLTCHADPPSAPTSGRNCCKEAHNNHLSPADALLQENFVCRGVTPPPSPVPPPVPGPPSPPKPPPPGYKWHCIYNHTFTNAAKLPNSDLNCVGPNCVCCDCHGPNPNACTESTLDMCQDKCLSSHCVVINWHYTSKHCHTIDALVNQSDFLSQLQPSNQFHTCMLVKTGQVPPTPTPTPPQYSPWVWTQVNSQGYGWVTGIVAHPNQTACSGCIFARTDVGGAFRLDRQTGHGFRWTPLMDGYGRGFFGIWAVVSLAVSPQADDVFVVVQSFNQSKRAEVLISKSNGEWTPTGLADQLGDVVMNSDHFTGERLAVDPHESDILLLGTQHNGTFRRRDGAWTRVVGLPTESAAPGVTFVTFADVKGRAFAGVSGHGIAESTDHGATWTIQEGCAFAESPRFGASLNGTLIFTYQPATGATVGGVGRFDWRDTRRCVDVGLKGNPGDEWSGVSAFGNDVVVVNGGWGMWHSSDSGQTFRTVGWQVDKPVPWYSRREGDYLATTTSIAIDPSSPTEMWLTNGMEVLHTDNWKTTQGSTQKLTGETKWQAVMLGLEELVCNACAAPPQPDGADLILLGMDGMGLRHQSREEVPETGLREAIGLPGLGLTSGQGIAYCAADPNVVAVTAYSEEGISGQCTNGISTDNGRSFTRYCGNKTLDHPGVPAYATAGAVALGGEQCETLLWAPAHVAAPKGTQWCLLVSHDQGKSFSCSSGLPSDVPFQQAGPWSPARNLAVSSRDLNTFFFVHNWKGVFRSTDSGRTWQQRSKPNWPLPTGWMLFVTLLHEADSVWLGARRDDLSHPAQPLWRSQDEGATWAPVPSTSVVNFFAFGKASSNTSVPTLFMHGTTSALPGLESVYRSADLGQSWQQIADPMANGFGLISGMCADVRDEVVYVVLHGRGVFYGMPGNSTDIDRNPQHAIETV